MPVAIGQPIPEFTLTDEQGQPVALQSLFAGDRRSLIIFHRHLG